MNEKEIAMNFERLWYSRIVFFYTFEWVITIIQARTHIISSLLWNLNEIWKKFELISLKFLRGRWRIFLKGFYTVFYDSSLSGLAFKFLRFSAYLHFTFFFPHLIFFTFYLEKEDGAITRDTKIRNFVFSSCIRDRRRRGKRRKTPLVAARAIIAIGEIVGQLSRWQFYSPCMAYCAKRAGRRSFRASLVRRDGGEGKEILEHVFATFRARYRENSRWKVGPVDGDLARG